MVRAGGNPCTKKPCSKFKPPIFRPSTSTYSIYSHMWTGKEHGGSFMGAKFIFGC
jgi:hypothetical protein